MSNLKRKDSDAEEIFLIEWLEQQTINCLSITVLLSIVNNTEKQYFDLLIYYSNIINEITSFKITFLEAESYQKMMETQNQLVFLRNNANLKLQIKNYSEFLQEWLTKQQAGPFLITFLISPNQKDLIQSTILQAVKILNFFKSISQNSNLDDIYEKTIKFVKTLNRVDRV